MGNNHGRVSSGSVVSSVSSSACQRLTVEALRQLEIETQHLGHWRSASDMFLASPPESDTSSQESSPLYSPFTGVQQQQQQQQRKQQHAGSSRSHHHHHADHQGPYGAASYEDYLDLPCIVPVVPARLILADVVSLSSE